MNNQQNLVPNEARTPEQRRENARKAGKASGQARRKKKEFREVLEELLTLPSAELEGMTNLEAVCVAMLKKAQSGNVYAALFVRDTVGQKPTEKVAQTGALTIGWDDKVSDMIMEARERADKLRANPPEPIEVQPERLPGEFHREQPKPDNRIVYSPKPKPEPKKREKVASFEYSEPETSPKSAAQRARRLQRFVQEQERQESEGFGAGYKSWGDA